MQEISLSLPQFIAVSVIPVLFAITVHEVAHGWAAKRLGDPTAQRLGRLTLNPLKHIDPIGTVLVPAMLVLVGSRVLFGWAKPVPVTWENLRNPRRDMVLVAAAGPAANLLMAVLWALAMKLGVYLPSVAAQPLSHMGYIGIQINVVLMVFNLLPLPPLDGGRVAVGMLPGKWGWYLSRVEPYGFFILLALMVSGLLWLVIRPLVNAVTALVGVVAGF